ncbi:unnamed protein product [Phytophthora fragariaefolia]|uniref:Unnamed protein product n=1 Tax=Phytophthora fragariaefolia TaxID=1490495 RepID=A0A9W6UEX9_9STRA|nr:unnamed protein product [Phytophthora fragariaefolia]
MAIADPIPSDWIEPEPGFGEETDDEDDPLTYGGSTGKVRQKYLRDLTFYKRFSREQQQTARQRPATASDLETYRDCCRQLVTYMTAQMDTSPGFANQMEQIIRASYSSSGGFTLSSMVTEPLWVRYNRSIDAGASVTHTPARREHVIKIDTANDHAVAVTPLAVANANVTGLRPTCSPHVDLTSRYPTVGRGGKRQSRVQESQETKRPRHVVARNLYGAGKLDCEEKDEEDESGHESTQDSETETETEGQGATERQQAAPRQSDGNDGGLVWPCAGTDPMNRTPAYKQRLKTAIKLVDAENCNPPLGMVCTQRCDRDRSRMCDKHRNQGGNAMPCHNGMCCIWREIDTHTVRCQNSQCEFKNSVGLRQTMHGIQQSEQKLQATTDKLLAARAILARASIDAQGRGKSSAASQLESKIKRLEDKCARLEDTVAFHKEREGTFRADLNTVGANDEFLQTFESHYVKKRSRED